MLGDLQSENVSEYWLEGSFEEMGQQYIAQAGPQILAQQQFMKQQWFDVLNAEEKQIFTAKINNVLKLVKSDNQVFYPNEIKTFMQSMAETAYAKENNLTLDDLITLDLALFISMLHPRLLNGINQTFDHCSLLAITQDKNVAVGRNLDWPMMPMPVLNQNPTILHLKPNMHDYPNVVTVVGPAGCISAFTIMNEHGLFWAHNSATTALHQKDNIYFDRPLVSADALIKMFKISDFNTLKQALLNTPYNYPSILNIAEPGNYEMASIEASPTDPRDPGNRSAFVNMLFEKGSKNAVVKSDNIKKRGYVSTNLVRGDWEPILGKQPAENTPTFAKQRKDALQARVDESHQRPSDSLMKTLTNYLSRPLAGDNPEGATKIVPPKAPFESDITTTHYSIAYCPNKQKAKIAFQKINTQNEQVEGHLTNWRTFKTHRMQP
jgi:hypothetical protein